MKYKCLSWNKDYSNKTDEESKKRFIKNTFKISNNDINKFILLLREHVYPYEYMDEWEKLMKYYHLKISIVLQIQMTRMWKGFPKIFK